MALESPGSAAGFCVFVGVVNVLCGGVILGGGFSRELETAAWISIGEGLIYMALAVGVAKENKWCALAAAGLYTLDSVFYVANAGPGAGIFIRGFLMLGLWKAAFGMMQNQAYAAEVAARPLEYRPPVHAPQAPAHVPPPRPSQRRAALPVGPRCVCPNCQKPFAVGTARCPMCNVETLSSKNC